ncbi:hypothetical protein [Stenotrophomonas sp. PS02298]|uniref:hypothetical protein n=1 Tax=Stenotrophomonas sp. PS02298 TaxID=2991424 RepID=UPI00249BF235|nr:hypothetical protein [Stenotrophomonas sp. PS02298]
MSAPAKCRTERPSERPSLEIPLQVDQSTLRLILSLNALGDRKWWSMSLWSGYAPVITALADAPETPQFQHGDDAEDCGIWLGHAFVTVSAEAMARAQTWLEGLQGRGVAP